MCVRGGERRGRREGKSARAREREDKTRKMIGRQRRGRERARARKKQLQYKKKNLLVSRNLAIQRTRGVFGWRFS